MFRPAGAEQGPWSALSCLTPAFGMCSAPPASAPGAGTAPSPAPDRRGCPSVRRVPWESPLSASRPRTRRASPCSPSLPSASPRPRADLGQSVGSKGDGTGAGAEGARCRDVLWLLAAAVLCGIIKRNVLPGALINRQIISTEPVHLSSPVTLQECTCWPLCSRANCAPRCLKVVPHLPWLHQRKFSEEISFSQMPVI